MDNQQRAREAQSLLDSQLFREARADIEGRLQNARRSVPISERRTHTELILMEQLWLQLIGYFEQLVQTGKFLEAQQAERERQKNYLEQGLAMFRSRGRGAM